MDCVIEPKMVMIYIQPNYVTTWFVTASSASTGSTAFNIFPNACTPNLMLATSSNYGVANVAVSKSYFLASNEPILTGAYNLDSSGVKAIAATSLGVTVLTTNSAVYFVNFASMSPIQATGLGSGITNIRAANICSSQSKNLNTHVVAWMSISGVTAFYYSTDGGQTFFAVDLVSNLSASGTAKIRDILVSQQQQSYIIMIRDGTNDKLFLYNTVLGTVTAGYSFGSSSSVIDSNAGASPFMTEGQGSLLFSGDSLFMSPDFGQTMFTVTLQSRDSARPATGLASSEWVKQTVIAPDGSAFAVLTSNNRLFYGQPGISTAIELTSGLLTTSLAQIGFDGLQRLIVYTPTSTANYVISRVIPVSNEILSPRYSKLE
ncbi:hypothetical protein BCR33DRAFT_412872 [Rhizoclosmatium globosum]|uniref:CATSPERD beta-propeller domain-containing protein n=1 Tax=Rhizoclosmatium globosum TaxID=329046 RepID=A0A1Y2BXA8_9FUNG|nr:hypothetical protein BCR33DRAFT_412872 [Rhizoclosmatium globosum]|eukprot:ORY39391.1 hypothetical protein BCR33DRAFT_412872 [Rhizoclosmatium globosum]